MRVFTTNNQLSSECGVGFPVQGFHVQKSPFLVQWSTQASFFTGQENDYQKLLGICWLKVTFLEFATSNQVN